MLLFVDNGRNVLITKSDIPTYKAAFYLEEFDQYAQAIILDVQVKPAPAIQVHGSVGGQSYLNVFGEEPLRLTLTGIVAGNDCDNNSGEAAALGVAVSIFSQLGVVQRAIPLTFRLDRSRARSAFLIGFDAGQNSEIPDISNFRMELIAEPLAEIGIPKPVESGTEFVPTKAPIGATYSRVTPASSALVSPGQVVLSSRGSNIAVSSRQTAGVLLSSNGEPVNRTPVPLVIPGFAVANGGF